MQTGAGPGRPRLRGREVAPPPTPRLKFSAAGVSLGLAWLLVQTERLCLRLFLELSGF